MRIPIFTVDAFTDKIFGGNPAAVCMLDSWLPDNVLQNIATENNLSETAFMVRQNGYYKLRWFTPTIEVDLCGHATLASAFVIFAIFDTTAKKLEFKTKSGMLLVQKVRDLLTMDFPACKPEPTVITPLISEALGIIPWEVHKSRDLLVILSDENQVRELKPDFIKLAQIPDCLGTIVSAPGNEVDFVSRFFAPAAGISEDPVTGSAHCTLVPFWAERLAKTRLHARQVSRRGGELWCEDRGERVMISGKAVLYARGEILLEEFGRV